MSRKKVRPIDENDLQGFKYFKVICRLLERLHQVGCQRDRAHNRTLHMDQYMALLLLYMFNPICESLRGIQRASELAKVQKILKVPRASLGSLSEAVQVFDSGLLREIIGELADQLRPIPHAAKLDDIGGILTLVDGTLLAALPKMTWALWKDEHNALKAHVQFELLKGVPVAATITQANAEIRGHHTYFCVVNWYGVPRLQDNACRGRGTPQGSARYLHHCRLEVTYWLC